MFVLKNNRVENFVLQLSHLTKSFHRSCEENFFVFLSRKAEEMKEKWQKFPFLFSSNVSEIKKKGKGTKKERIYNV